MSPLSQLIKQHSQELIPQSTELAEKLTRFEDIRCLAFDIYGTLVISGSGDIGISASDHKEELLRNLLLSYELSPPEENLIDLLHAIIKEDHAASRKAGVKFPEVEIRDIWKRFFETTKLSAPDIEEFTVRYELAVNPVWPMPGLKEVINFAHKHSIILAIVSNAQFCTPLIFEAFLGTPPEGLGFLSDLSFYSYQHRQAKPGTYLYKELAAALAKRDISPEQTLYVGNDALNDIHPAAETGFRTALFAGSKRSLRLRKDRENLNPADAVITSLDSLQKIVQIS